MSCFKLNSFCIVTGASRGLGREIALQLAQEWSKEGAKSDLVLLARNTEKLKEVQEEIQSTCPGVTAHLVFVDLSDLGSLHKVFAECISKADETKHGQYVIVHNAGTTGNLSKPMSEQTDPHTLRNMMDLNFTSMSILTSLFLSRFTSGERKVVQLTSILAIKYLPSFGMYSATRAARNALIGVLAQENPDVRFITYSPGPCNTDMFQGVMETSHAASVRESFKGLGQRGKSLTCQESVAKLMKILRENAYENAEIIDYYGRFTIENTKT